MSSTAQQALDIVVYLQQEIESGASQPGAKNVALNTLAAVQLLAQSVLSATPASISVAGGSLTATDVATTTAVATPQQ